MKEGDQSSSSSNSMDNSFKPPDRSTSAPPVLSLDSLFAFRAAEHLQLFADIRCEDNYYEFYNKYQNQGKGGLPLPLENQPFMMGEGRQGGSAAYHEEEDSTHNIIHTPANHHQHQQQLQQLQHLQQQQQQLQQQMHLQQLQQLQQQQHQHQHQMHHPSHSQMSSQHHPSQQHLLQQYSNQQQQQHHSQHSNQHQSQHHSNQYHSHQQLQHQPQHLPHQHAHMPPRYNPEHRYSVPEIRNPPPVQRSTSGQGFLRSYDRFDPVAEEPSRIAEDLGSSTSPDPIWTPLPRKIAAGILALDNDYEVPSQRMPSAGQYHPNNNNNNSNSNTNNMNAMRDPNVYYTQPNDFDSLPVNVANQLLREDNISSLWDRGYDRQSMQQPQQPQHQQRSGYGQSIMAPTPTHTSQSSILNTFLGGNSGFFNELPADKLNQLQDRNVGDIQFQVAKNKKKTIASPPPLGINLPPKVPSPIHLSRNALSNGSGSHMNGSGSMTSPSGNGSISSIIAGMENMRFGNNGMGINPATSPQPVPRSTTPNSSSGLDMAFGGSTSPNGKSDLSRQYTSIDQVIGHIYSLCKDQHGCRFLQKKLEDRDPMVVELIFNEVYDHMTELMIDPFGNYLCQKLLEHCNDDQRLHIIEKVAPDLVKISKNMHGTRAVQKMIEYLTTPEQIAIAKKALSNHVVTLIQDLNGNHVIQRCLNRLSPQDNQFIYDSVSQAGHCVEVATHRHGCCVLQRCIDHASDSQKIQLINEIIANALVLVQDPYGNYVVQYVLDLPFPGLASRLARRFLGHIPILSTQKFSSNVVEKCLNVTDVQTRAAVIQELVEYDNLLYLLQDPYANYVIQTSLNVSEPVQHARLVEAIRPHLSSLRNTPYGKRIQNKILKESSRDYYA